MDITKLTAIRNLFGDENLNILTLDNGRYLTTGIGDGGIIKFDDDLGLVYQLKDLSLAPDLGYSYQLEGKLNITANEYAAIQNVVFTIEDPTSVITQFGLTQDEIDAIFSEESVQLQKLDISSRLSKEIAALKIELATEQSDRIAVDQLKADTTYVDTKDYTKLDKEASIATIESGSYSNLNISANIIYCDCTNGNITISGVDDTTAEIGKKITFMKIDDTENKVILVNSVNGGFINSVYSDDLEILYKNGIVEYVHL